MYFGTCVTEKDVLFLDRPRSIYEALFHIKVILFFLAIVVNISTGASRSAGLTGYVEE